MEAKKEFFSVTCVDKNSEARVGIIHTPHGDIPTPIFVPVGTQATVKSLTPDDLMALGVQIFFVNTYHVYLRPGLDTINKFGSLHKFMSWPRPIITDSGGFQVFSLGRKKYVNIAISESAVLDRDRFTRKLSKHELALSHVYPDDYRPVGELVRIDEDGVTFTSHWDGSRHRFTPEVSIDTQHVLGSDIMIAFDECAPYPISHDYALSAMERTHRWAKRSLEHHRNAHKAGQALYGVVQGSVYKDLRIHSSKTIASMDFDGIAIGGVAVGESKVEMRQVLKWTIPCLPDTKPRHLLGVGEIDDIFDLVGSGIDTFDCVQPTRLARMGRLFVGGSNEFDITKAVNRFDTNPIDEKCLCYTCQHYSRAYIHHLFHVRELLGYRLATIHNIHFMMQLLNDIRSSIVDGTFTKLKQTWLGFDKPSKL